MPQRLQRPQVTDRDLDQGVRVPRRSRRARRALNHIALGSASLVACAAIFAAVDSRDAVFRASIATAYVGLVLLAGTLAFGPIAALGGRRYPVSTDIRRDFGIWSAIIAIGHVAFGLQVHLRGKMWEYFVRPLKGVLLPRIDPFGAANYAGLGAVAILIALLATSNDVSLRRLGSTRWQRLHDFATWALVLTVVHGATYQFVEQRSWEFVVLFGTLSIAGAWPRLVRHRR